MTKAEKVVAAEAKRERLANCICKVEGTPTGMTVAWSPEMFEAEANRACPVHGFRRLGQLLIVSYIKRDKTYTEETLELHRLVEAYNLRLSQLPQSDIDFEDDSQAA